MDVLILSRSMHFRWEMIQIVFLDHVQKDTPVFSKKFMKENQIRFYFEIHVWLKRNLINKQLNESTTFIYT